MRGLADQVDDGRERLVGVMEEDVAAAEDIEGVGAALVGGGDGGEVDGVLELRPVDEVVEGVEPVQVDRAADPVEVVWLELELGQQELGDFVGAGVGDLDTNRLAVVSVGQLALEGLEEVVDLFFVDPEVAVAGDAKLVAACDLHAGEESPHVGVDDGAQEDEGVVVRGYRAWQPDDAGERARHLDGCELAAPSEGILALERDHEVEDLVEGPREGVGGVERDGCEDRDDLALEVALDPLLLRRAPLGAPEDRDAGLAQRGVELFVEDAVLLCDELVCLAGDLAKRLSGGESVGAALGGAGLHLFA